MAHSGYGKVDKLHELEKVLKKAQIRTKASQLSVYPVFGIHML